MGHIEFIRLISELGILVVIAGLYLYERFMSNRQSLQILSDLEKLMKDFNKKQYEKTQRNLSIYNFRSVVDLYLSSQKGELLKECDEIVTMNHIHLNEEATKQKILGMVQRVHERHKDFIDELYFSGKPLKLFLDNADFLQSKVDICSSWILGQDHHVNSLHRALDSYFERFKIKLEQV